MNPYLEFISPHKHTPYPHEESLNLKMEYMYRDAGNNKLRGFQIFSNNHRLSICQVADFMVAAFIDKKWFDPSLCGIEKLVFDRYDSDLDHEWHEVEEVNFTNDLITMDVDIADFLFNAIKVHARPVMYSCRKNSIEFDF